MTPALMKSMESKRTLRIQKANMVRDPSRAAFDSESRFDHWREEGATNDDTRNQ